MYLLENCLSNLLTQTRQIWQDPSMVSLMKQRSLEQLLLPFLLHNKPDTMYV